MIKKILIVAALILITGIVFQDVRRAEFLNFDDSYYLTENPRVIHGLSQESIAWAFRSGFGGNWFPLTWLTHLADFEWYGMDAGGHHLTNLIIHILAAMVLFLALVSMTDSIWKSALVAALFALHPLRLESVAWVVERKDVLSGLFAFLTIWFYARYAQKPAAFRYAITLFAYACGLMSKSMLVTLPAVLILIDYWPLERFGKPVAVSKSGRPLAAAGRFRAASLSALIWEKVPFFLLAVIVSIVTFIVQRDAGAVGTLDHYPLGIRIQNALIAVMVYLRKMFQPSDLAIFYPHPGFGVRTDLALVSALIVILISALVLWAKHRKGYWVTGWFWYLITLLPVIGLIQVGDQAYADRYTYLPMTGVLIALVWGVDATFGKTAWQKQALAVAAIAAVLVYAGMTKQQVRYWENSQTIFERALIVTKNNYVAHNNLGLALDKQGKVEPAMQQIHMALKIKPHYSRAHLNLGSLLAENGKLDEAIQHFRQAVQSDPALAKAHDNLGNALVQAGQIEEGIKEIKKAIELAPDDPSPYLNLGHGYAKKEDYQQAKIQFIKTLELDPANVRALSNLGNILLAEGKVADAKDLLQKALQIDPSYKPAQENMKQVAMLEQSSLEAAGISEPTAAEKMAALFDAQAKS